MQVIVPRMPVIPPDKTVVVAQVPHGAFPMAYWLSATVIGHSATGGNFTQGVVATVLLRVPIVKHLVAWVGAKPADRGVMLKLLREGCCVGTAPEGLAGTFDSCSTHEERVCLSRHKGYIRVALEAGVDILPVPLILE
ncbi:hypothetical protein WJX73_007009 [Symbiochloris irregularis]|uniref:16S rRNA (uracil(1498)-N(3))-methyltransferase n=1 Tax=Symbiochloris irregularis TaxID=706552 RepID=A0AAW1NWL1_9CHLO